MCMHRVYRKIKSYGTTLVQCLRRILDITGGDPSDSKSNRLHVGIFWLFIYLFICGQFDSFV